MVHVSNQLPWACLALTNHYYNSSKSSTTQTRSHTLFPIHYNGPKKFQKTVSCRQAHVRGQLELYQEGTKIIIGMFDNSGLLLICRLLGYKYFGHGSRCSHGIACRTISSSCPVTKEFMCHARNYMCWVEKNVSASL